MKDNAQPQTFGHSTSANNTKSASTFDRQEAMKKLAEMSLPVDTNTIMKNVDSVIADAIQTINNSLKLSSNYIDRERQKLMQQHPSLSQVYEQQTTAEVANQDGQQSNVTEPTLGEESGAPPEANPLNSLNNQANQTLADIAQGYESKLMATHQNKQQLVMDKQASLTQAAFDMQQQMMEKQQSYQQQLLGMDDPALNILSAEAEPQSAAQPEQGDQHPPRARVNNCPVRVEIVVKDNQ